MTDRARNWEVRVADALAALFAVVILIYAASGPLGDLIRWLIESMVADFEELSRRDQRLLLKNHWLGAGFKAFERGFLLPTGLILGLPILFSFVISFLKLPASPQWRWVNILLACATLVTFTMWTATLFSIGV